MITLQLPEFSVLLRLPGWTFKEEISFSQSGKRQSDSEEVTGVITRRSCFEKGLLNDQESGHESIEIVFHLPFRASRQNPENTLKLEPFESPEKRWSFSNLIVSASDTSSRMYRFKTLEPSIPGVFSSPDLEALKARVEFTRQLSESGSGDSPTNQRLRELVRQSPMARPEIARRSGVSLNALHNYMAKSQSKKFRVCPESVLEQIETAINEF